MFNKNFETHLENVQQKRQALLDSVSKMQEHGENELKQIESTVSNLKSRQDFIRTSLDNQ